LLNASIKDRPASCIYRRRTLDRSRHPIFITSLT
jgi:hypothetical protein